MGDYIFFGILAFAGFVLPTIILAVMLRRVVPANEVHIVQASGSTTSYGKDTKNGNTYYEWPSWVPLLGINKVTLPVSVFAIDLEDYEAYDKGRLPFSVDVKAFFRISDSNLAAQRVSNFTELHNQLKAIVQGAVRSVLASFDIEEIMQGRGKFGDEFTKEVVEQLGNWGVITVKNIELMDLRDGQNGHAIKSIMEKKKSHIEMESRTEVAKNQRMAQIAEVEAGREVDIQKQQAIQAVGLRTTESTKAVSLANQEAAQAVKEAERETREKEMAVIRVQTLRQAEINRDSEVVKADQERQKTVIFAEAKLEQQKKDADGIEAQGKAKAEAEKAMQLAPVQAQITLAKEIGTNENYQKYLVTIRQVEANQLVGIEQAKALQQAEVKVIANTGDAPSGVKSVMDLFSAKGGTNIGAMLEGLANTPAGKSAITKLLGEKPDSELMQ